MPLMKESRRLASAGRAVKVPACRRASVPANVPIHRSPFVSVNRLEMALSPRAGVVLVVSVTNRAPSKRTRPVVVPTQR